MTRDEIIAAWNAQSDYMNQWETLGEDEKLEWAMKGTTEMSKEVLKLALEALELHGKQYPHMVKGYCLDAIAAIKQALEQPVQEPVAYCEIHYLPEPCAQCSKEHEGYNTPPAAPAQEFVCSTGLCHYRKPQQEPDWKAEYLKSVESGCITLDELREALAELDATNKQVEILSDALAESRRGKKNV